METITLGGREFQPVKDGTIEHDYWMMGLIRRAGIDRVVIEDGETAEEFALRLMRELVNSGEAFTILGGVLMPAQIEVSDWTPQMARETADFLKHLTDPKDKQTLNGCTASLLAGFFESGLVALLTSRRSTGNDAASPSGESASAVH